MSTTTLSCIGATYINNLAKTADNSSEANLLTSYLFAIKDKTYIENAASNSVGIDFAIFRFTKSSTLKYKRINRVTLNFTTTWANATGSAVPYAIAPYKSDAALSGINYTTYETNGVLGTWITGTKATATGASGSYTESVDITSLFNNNLVSDYFNIAIAAVNTVHAGSSSASIAKSSVTLTVDYDTVTQLAPTAIYPKDVTLLESTSTLFSWQFNSETEATQAGVTLEYKLTSAGSYTTVSLTTTEHSYQLNASLPAGAYQWRLKATNDIAEVSGYSNVAYFNIIGKPAAPVIETPANKTLTTINWSAAEQFACEIRLLDADQNELIHETLATTSMTYKPNIFLKGSYTFMLRIKNASDLWSDWAQMMFTISASGPTAATFTAMPKETSVLIEYTLPSGTAGALLRYVGDEYKVLAVLDNNAAQYVDDTVEPGINYRYVIRTYINGYTDTTPKAVTVRFDGAIIASADGTIRLRLSEENFIPYSETMSRDMSVMQFSGREYPMIERGTFTTVEFNRRFFVTFEEKKLLDSMAKTKNLFYRDDKGNAFECAVISISYTEFRNEGYIAQVSMIRTAEDEVILNV